MTINQLPIRTLDDLKNFAEARNIRMKVTEMWPSGTLYLRVDPRRLIEVQDDLRTALPEHREAIVWDLQWYECRGKHRFQVRTEKELLFDLDTAFYFHITLACVLLIAISVFWAQGMRDWRWGVFAFIVNSLYGQHLFEREARLHRAQRDKTTHS